MPILPGRRLGPYEILAAIGAGGMGEVYKARDTRLDRIVAIKVLPAHLADRSELRERFEREARTIASLNHPHICTLFDIGQQNGIDFLVMEYLEGETLERRLAKSALPIQLALQYAIEIADALEVAHAQGIIHRDIKPANIFITQRGQVKILDFGIAKIMQEFRTGVSDHSGKSPTTVDFVFTVPGAQIGTFAFMSPEQERGEQLDARTDLFSFGLLLYDMATGWTTFSDKVAAVIHDAVGGQASSDKKPSQTGLTPEFGKIISKATEVDRALRYQTAAEMRADLERLRGLPGPEATVGGVVPQIRSKGWIGKLGKALIASGIVLAAAGFTAFLYLRRAPVLTDKDTIVLADVDNETGDPVFDNALKQALAVDLEQSPFLNILSDRKVAETLRLMSRSPDQPVTGEVASELCQRVGSKAMLTGSIAALGNHFVIGLNAINCATGDALVKELAEAPVKEDVLRALGNAATDMRTKLGESLTSVQKFATPIEEATTSSLEALKAYSMARRALYANGDAAALPYYQRAVELDPNFALAYRSLAIAYSNLGQSTRASQNADRAFHLRERASERERDAIDSFYYSLVTGDLEKANQVYELWKQSYPRDGLPFGDLGDNFMRLGQWEKALKETEDSLRLEPNMAMTNSNLAFTQLALNRTNEARTTVQQALAHKMDDYFLRLALYEAAFLRGDEESMQQQVAWASERPGEEDWLLSAQSDTEAYFGRLDKSREFSQRAIEAALRADANETAALWQVNAALREAEVGNANSARHDAVAALTLMSGKDIRSAAALSLARAGDPAEAKRIADSLNRDFPQDTLIQGYWLPAIQAAIEINAKNPAKAIELLKTAAPYELRQCEPFQFGMLYPIYLRGEAHLLAGQGKDAAAEFQRIVDHPGVVLNFPLGALAYVGLGRAYALQNNTAGARTAYQKFFTLWKDADPNIPILIAAKSEYAKLK